MGDWDPVVKEWLVDVGSSCAGGIANAEDGAVFAAAADDDDGWSKLCAEDHDQEVMDEEGNTKTATINEAATIKKAFDEMKGDVWVGKHKFKVVKGEKDAEYNDCTFDTLLLAKSKGGMHMVKTVAGSIIMAIFDEEKGQDKGSCGLAALQFAEYLSQQGF